MDMLRVAWFLGLLVLIVKAEDDVDVQCKNPDVMCARYCEFGFKISAEGCKMCDCEEEVCQGVQCTLGKVCKVYTLTASGHKISRCVDTRLPEKCWPAMDSGPCRDQQVSKVFYNTETDLCEPFFYGGCGGNDNIFESIVECDATCEPCPELECGKTCADGFQLDERGCKTCSCVGEETACLPMTCQMFCDYGFKKDANQCDICECEKCPTVMCQMHCDTGFQTDSDGCQICVCNDPVPEPVSPVCPEMFCMLYCETGMPLDANGCPICQCLESIDSSECAEVTCDRYCENGLVKDASGCDTCQCVNVVNHLNVKASECPDVICQMYCPTGYVTDELGCETCECRPKDACPEVMCALHCDDGFQVNEETGCKICRCKSWGEVEPGCLEVECRMYCEYGFKMDARGCKICSCQDDPCEVVDCPSGQKCIVEKGQTMPTCIDENAHTWCPPYMCSMFCEHGFKSDQMGCEACMCLTEPKPKCFDVTCQQVCPYGYKFTQYGCRTCECLPDPCATKACKEHHVCELTEPDCPTCPSLGICIGNSQVQRVGITVSYNHNEVDDFDLSEFKKEFRRRMHYLLEMDQEYIRAITVEEEDPHRTTVSFHAVSYGEGDIVQKFDDFKGDIMAHIEGTALLYNGVTYIPDHHSVSAAYYQDPNVEYDDDSNEYDDYEDNSAAMGVIIGCSIAGAIAIILLIVVIVFVVKANKQKGMGKPNVAYKKAPDSQQQPEKEPLPEV